MKRNILLKANVKALNTFWIKNVDAVVIEPCKSALPNPYLDLYKEFDRRNIPVIFLTDTETI